MAGQMWDLAATPIGQAISAGDVDKVNSLVKDGENILFKDRKGNTYLHYVCTMYQPRDGKTADMLGTQNRYWHMIFQKYKDMIYGVFEGNHEKISVKKHILQYAIKFKDYKFVKMLCDAGADINASGADVNTSVRVNNYFWGPLYFEVLHKDIPHDIMWHVLKSGADFTLKDERGRTGFMYALDKVNGDMPLEVFQYMLSKGADITERDCTGCNPRDIARFARRRDVVELIDKYRDTFIYASGNKTDDVLQFIQWLPRFQRGQTGEEFAQREGGEHYEKEDAEGNTEIKYYTPAERAAHLGFHDLSECLRDKQRRQLDKLRNHTPLLPKRAIKKHFAVDPQEYQRPKSCVFVTQSVV
ncbi:hypothetical protein MAR_034592 [Mya arenaria]|uniref:Uncharacterized protein n=1 Tax=Mya arenaria TaxID=6604 RepID=A0ABY7EL97_MYAAR|nr:hypothetical protein MAR_034592 [Mya arenaria]